MEYKIFKETKEMSNKTEEQLKRDMTNSLSARIEYAKRMHGLVGDVYFITPSNYLENLRSHLSAFPDSKATTIEEMAQERITQIEKEKADTAKQPVREV